MIRKGHKVIFKQRTARHLARTSLKWEYEFGNVVTYDKKNQKAGVVWLQGHHSRVDTVPLVDIVAVHDNRCKSIKIGAWKGKSRILQEIVEEGK